MGYGVFHVKHNTNLILPAGARSIVPSVRLAINGNITPTQPSPLRREGFKPEFNHTLKYLALGWWTTRAEVDCSGWIWNSSERDTPRRSASSSLKMGT